MYCTYDSERERKKALFATYKLTLLLIPTPIGEGRVLLHNRHVLS